MKESELYYLGIEFLKPSQYYHWKSRGFKDSEILVKLGYSPHSQEIITKWKRKNGITMYRTGKRNTGTLDKFTPEQFIELKLNGVTHKEIASSYGVHYNTLDKWITEQKKLGAIPNKPLRRFDYKELKK